MHLCRRSVEEANIGRNLVNAEVEEDAEVQALHQAGLPVAAGTLSAVSEPCCLTSAGRAQVVEVLQRLTQLRASVPQAVQEQVTATLEQQRPAEPARKPLGAGQTDAEVEQLLPDAQNLQGLLSLTSKRLPSLRHVDSDPSSSLEGCAC